VSLTLSALAVVASVAAALVVLLPSPPPQPVISATAIIKALSTGAA
jgi:hypothetical protein